MVVGPVVDIHIEENRSASTSPEKMLMGYAYILGGNDHIYFDETSDPFGDMCGLLMESSLCGL